MSSFRLGRIAAQWTVAAASAGSAMALYQTTSEALNSGSCRAFGTERHSLHRRNASDVEFIRDWPNKRAAALASPTQSVSRHVVRQTMLCGVG